MGRDAKRKIGERKKIRLRGLVMTTTTRNDPPAQSENKRHFTTKSSRQKTLEDAD